MVKNKAAVIVCCLLALCSTLAAGTIIIFKTCDEDKAVGKLISIDVNPCPVQPCVFHKRTNVTANITFCPHVTVTDGTLEVYGILEKLRRKVPFPLKDPGACKHHGLECPLKANVTYSLKITLPIKPWYPSLQLRAQMDFKVLDKKNLFCFQFPIRIARVGVLESEAHVI